ncbi:MAG: lipopolysaccharide heptosyltransferase II [Candidatus Solibacter usitatus]|nr:lipopolysaccharide heptosyltransferase II [Candidatus Solibacter usitatus]
MSLPALAAVRARFPQAHIAVLARPWVEGLYRRQPFADEIIPYQPAPGWQGVQDRLAIARLLRRKRFDCAVLLQNAFDAALVTFLAGIPRRIGYARDGRAPLLTSAVPVPDKGAIPPHESFYYLELLRRIGWLDQLPSQPLVRLAGIHPAPRPLIGVSPGAAFGSAKRWLPERFAESAALLAAPLQAGVAIFGSAQERTLCEQVRGGLAARGIDAHNHAGETTLEEFISLAASCMLFLTNDSGAMHIASALGVPTVAVFGATNHVTTGPTGPLARVVRHGFDCSPCLLRECPIDHRCMTAVASGEVVAAAHELLLQMDVK